MQALTFVLAPSRILTILFFVIHLAMGTIIFIVDIPFLFNMLCLMALSWHGIRMVNTHSRKIAKHAITHLWRDTKGRWGYQTKKGFRAIGNLKGDSFRSQWLLILHIRHKTFSQWILIPRDALNKAEYRILSTALILH